MSHDSYNQLVYLPHKPLDKYSCKITLNKGFQVSMVGHFNTRQSPADVKYLIQTINLTIVCCHKMLHDVLYVCMQYNKQGRQVNCRNTGRRVPISTISPSFPTISQSPYDMYICVSITRHPRPLKYFWEEQCTWYEEKH